MRLISLQLMYLYSLATVGAKSLVDIELLFVILYNITAVHHNTNFYGHQVS